MRLPHTKIYKHGREKEREKGREQVVQREEKKVGKGRMRKQNRRTWLQYRNGVGGSVLIEQFLRLLHRSSFTPSSSPLKSDRATPSPLNSFSTQSLFAQASHISTRSLFAQAHSMPLCSSFTGHSLLFKPQASPVTVYCSSFTGPVS
ncbi:unnamed protein product [Ilex paraguariensis]|uniref:Uncharacterized protein n=1 Tax=Ilex paraguariensis TaxID=185542 RepID=A0ABC8R0R7_9AQUA